MRLCWIYKPKFREIYWEKFEKLQYDSVLPKCDHSTLVYIFMEHFRNDNIIYHRAWLCQYLFTYSKNICTARIQVFSKQPVGSSTHLSVVQKPCTLFLTLTQTQSPILACAHTRLRASSSTLTILIHPHTPFILSVWPFHTLRSPHINYSHTRTPISTLTCSHVHTQTRTYFLTHICTVEAYII